MLCADRRFCCEEIVTMPSIDRPIFVGGFYKSGTTLLRTLIGKHSKIYAGLESYWFNLDFDARENDAFKSHIDRIRAFYDLTQEDAERLVSDSRSAETFLHNTLSFCMARDEKTRWCEKTPGNIIHVDRIFAHWPEAKFVNIVRNPLDVLTSMHQAGRTDWVAGFPENWVQFVGKSERRFAKNGLSSACRVRYECVINTTVETMRTTFRYLDEPWEDAVAEYEGDDSEFKKVRDTTGKASTTLERMRDPLNASRVGIASTSLPSELEAETRRRIAALGFGEELEHLLHEDITASISRE